MASAAAIIDFDDPSFDEKVLEWKHEENTSKEPRAVEMAAECRRRLIEATAKIANGTNPATRGLILSGGVDTCAILEAAATRNITFVLAITVVIGETSPDEYYAKYAARKHGLKHVVVRMTHEELIDTHLPRTIKTLEVWDGMTIRNSLVISAAFEEAKKHGLTDVLVGDGADELFAGYSFTWGDQNDPTGWKEKRDSMCRKWTFATDDLAESYGLVAHAPYTDQDIMVEWSLNETERQDCVADDREIQLILGQPYETHTTGKILLREAFKTGSSWRRKDPIEVGSGATIIGRDAYWSENFGITDEEFRTERDDLKEKGIIINSKEYLVNIRTYQRIFGGIVHSTKKRLPLGEGCVGCCFEIGDAMFCHLCGAWPAQRWKVAQIELEKQSKNEGGNDGKE